MIFFRQKCDFYDTFMILLIIFREKSHCRQLLIYQLDITVQNIKNDTLILFIKNKLYVRVGTNHNCKEKERIHYLSW